MTIVSKAQQDAFEADHRERCGADEFNEEAENNCFYDRRERGSEERRDSRSTAQVQERGVVICAVRFSLA